MDRTEELNDLIEEAKRIEAASKRAENALIEAIGDNEEAINWFEFYKERQQRLGEMHQKLTVIQLEQFNSLVDMVEHTQKSLKEAFDKIDSMELESDILKVIIDNLRDSLQMQTVKLDYLGKRN